MRSSRFQTGAIALALAALLAASSAASASTRRSQGPKPASEAVAGALSDFGSFCADLWRSAISVVQSEPAAPGGPEAPGSVTGDEGSSLDPHG